MPQALHSLFSVSFCSTPAGILLLLKYTLPVSAVEYYLQTILLYSILPPTQFIPNSDTCLRLVQPHSLYVERTGA